MLATLSSKRYAQAAFEIATEKDKLEEWRSNLRKISELTREPEVVSFLENPKIPFESKAKLMQEGLKGVDPLALNLVYLLVIKDRIRTTEQIAEEYERLLDEYHGIRHAQIITAIPIDEPTKARLNQRLEALIGNKVSARLQVDPNILGGFVARIDDSLIDFSVRNKLELLRKELVETRR
jgi:F-type H+-transporting ATPase subunit delta